MHLFNLFGRSRNYFVDEIENPDLVFALWKNSKTRYFPGCIVGPLNQKAKTLPVYFLHNELERDVNVDDIIYHHSNLMMMKISFIRRGKEYWGVVYGNDSPKHDGRPKTFFIRLSKRVMVSVPVKHVFLTRFQAQKLLQCRIDRSK